MSHDRGCHCGKEPYEYRDCRDRECARSPVYDPVHHAKEACRRLGRIYVPGKAPLDCPRDVAARPPVTFEPKVPPQVVRLAEFTVGRGKRVLLVGQEGRSHSECLPVGGEAEIAGPSRVRVGRGGRLEVVVNHDVPIRWTPAGRKGRVAPSNGGDQ
jgi:hypothetical protein